MELLVECICRYCNHDPLANIPATLIQLQVSDDKEVVDNETYMNELESVELIVNQRSKRAGSIVASEELAYMNPTTLHCCKNQLWAHENEEADNPIETDTELKRVYKLTPMLSIGDDEEYLNKLHKYVQIVKAINHMK